MPRNTYKVVQSPTGMDNTNDTMSTADNTAQCLTNFLCDRAGMIRAQVQLQQVCDLSNINLLGGVKTRAYGLAYYYGAQSIPGFDGQGNAIVQSIPNPSADRLVVQIADALYACAYTGIGADPRTQFYPPYPPVFDQPVLIPTEIAMAGRPFPRIRSTQFTKELIIVQSGSNLVSNMRYYVDVNSVEPSPDPGNIYDLGIRTPASLVVGVDLNYGSPTTSYKQGVINYTYTLGDEFGRQSSPPTSASLDFNANPGKDAIITLTIDNTGLTPQPYYFAYIYGTVQGGSTFYLLHTFTLNSGYNSLTWGDNEPDSVVETYPTGPRYGQNDPPNPANLVANFKNRIWLNDVGNPNTIQVSNLNSPTQFNSLGYIPTLGNVDDGVTLQVDRDYGDPVTGMVVFGSFLIIAKQKGLYQVYGSDASSFQIQPMQSTRGCVAPDTFLRCENVLFYLSDDGVYQFDGVNCQKVSKPIESSLLGYKLNGQSQQYSNAQAAYVARRYILNIGTDIYVYDLDSGGWTTWLFGVYVVDYILASYGLNLNTGVTIGNNPPDAGVPNSTPVSPFALPPAINVTEPVVYPPATA
jgi:hypothetical protein